MPANYIDDILNSLAKLPYANKIVVFGSTARGKSDPGDVDAVINFRDQKRSDYLLADPGGKALAPLIRLAAAHYGGFDPFVRFAGKDMIVRDDEARNWIKSKNVEELHRNMDAEGKPLKDVIAMRQAMHAKESVAAHDESQAARPGL